MNRYGMFTGGNMCESGTVSEMPQQDEMQQRGNTHLHTQPAAKTRTGTHHSRALDSPLALAKLRTAIFV